MTQDQNRHRTSQGSDQPRQYREQRPPHEQQRGPSHDQPQRGPQHGRGGQQPRGQSQSPPTGGQQGQQGGRHGSQHHPPTGGGPSHQQGRQPAHGGGHSTGGQFEQGQPGRTEQPPQRQPPQTGRGQPPREMGSPPEQRTGGQPQGGMGGQSRGQMGTPSRGEMGGQSQGRMGGQPQRSMSTTPQQSMGAQSGQAMGTTGGMASRQLPVEPVGAEALAETDVVTASRDDPITSLVERMADEDVGTVVIVEDDRPVGIVTDRKIALALAERPDASEMTAEDVMTEDPVTVTDETSVFEVIQTLGDSGIRRVPIVDDDGTLTGIVSVDDMLVLLAAELDQLGEVVERQIERF